VPNAWWCRCGDLVVPGPNTLNRVRDVIERKPWPLASGWGEAVDAALPSRARDIAYSTGDELEQIFVGHCVL
jgi:hypothetical protein